MNATTTYNRDADFARIFVGSRQISVTHFYSIGIPDDADYEDFAVGYWTHDGIFIHRIVRWDGENFSNVK